jgi:PAS domain S-box-containing protein
MYGKITILNLEDDIGDAELIKEAIESEQPNWEITSVTTGEEFVREFIKNRYDIILSDYKVPGYSGIKALELVRSKNSIIPFIFVSGSMGEEMAVEMIKKGATDYVLKDKLFKLPAAIIRALKEAKAEKEKLEMQRRLKESEEKYKQIIDTALVGVYQTNEKGEITFANQTMAQILDFLSPDELKKYNALEFYKDQEEREKLLKILKSKGRANGFETELVTKDNKTKNVLMSVNYVGDSYTGMMVDITDRRKYIEGLKAAKERAENLNKIKSNFLGTISHEMRTPMIGILGFTDILRKEVKDEEQKEVADIIYESSKRLMNTLNLILDLSRVESNKQELQLCDVNISDTIMTSTEVLQSLAKEKNLYLQTEIKNHDIIVHLDESLLIKVINNLIDNAIKFTDKGGVKIELESRQIDNRDYAVIKVIDTGIGIDEQYHSIIFEEFRQVSEGLSRSFEGTGLGLTISKKYVELMGGKISVHSKPGEGSTFEVIFPIVNAEAEQVLVEPEQETAKDIENVKQIPEFKIKPKILQVEDDWASIMYVKKCLNGKAELKQVKNGEEALELVKNEQFDVILMDINLKGGMNGLEITEKIRNLKNYEITPIVAVTAFAMKGDKEEFLSKGCTHYLAKPFHREELLDLINMLINK